MNANTKNWLMCGLILFSLILAFIFWSQMPDRMITYWNASGQPDGWGPKWLGLLILPFVLLFMYLLYFVIPKIDPLRKNIMKFYSYYQNFVLVIMSFMTYVYVLSILQNLDYQFSMNMTLFPAMAFLFYYIGVVLEKAKRNWFLGIRTPWTMSSDRVWEKTHRLGGKLFKALAVIMLFGLLLEKHAIWIILIPIFAVTIYLVVYSYLEFRKEEKR